MTVGIISHPDCDKHEPGQDRPERPDRLRAIRNAIKKYPFTTPIQEYEAPLATRDQLVKAHDGQYIDWICSISPEAETISIDEDTNMCPDTLRAAQLAAGAVPLAVDLVMKGELQAAFCLVRPPGHHAEKDKAMGFCFFNNIAVGAAHALAEHGLQRIAIVDFDVHHGNGTQQIFHKNRKVLLCSSFQHPLYPGYDDEMDSAYMVSVPLPAGTKGDVFREKVQNGFFGKIDEFKPELIMISAGFDGHEKDQLANLCLDKSDYVWLTQELAKLAKKHCQGRMVSALEGGYDLDVLAECVPAHIDMLSVIPNEVRDLGDTSPPSSSG